MLQTCNRANTSAPFQDKRNIEDGNVEAKSDWLFYAIRTDIFTNDFTVSPSNQILREKKSYRV